MSQPNAGAVAPQTLRISPQLDREVGQAPPGISTRGSTIAPVGHDSTQSVRPATVEVGFVGRERQTAGDDGEEEPGTEVGVDEAAVLSDPPEACALGVRPLVNRTGVDEGAGLERLGVLGAHPVQEAVKPPADDLVVVLAPRVA
jgi:hypothetical protein